MNTITGRRTLATALLLAAALVIYLAAATAADTAPGGGPPPELSRPAPALSLPIALQVQLTALDGAVGDYFGQAVAVSGDTAVVGAGWADVDGKADQGSAYVFVRTGTTWSQQAKLTSGDGAAGQNFGYSVAIAGDTVAIGARDAAYVFVRAGTTWTEQAKLTVPPSFRSRSVAVAGDTVVVGATDEDGYTGAAYVFVRDGATWTQQARLTAADRKAYDYFGFCVAISGDTAAVGAVYSGSSGQGSAYIFTRSGTVWTQQAQLNRTGGVGADRLGASVAVSGNTAVAGIRPTAAPFPEKADSAYAFKSTNGLWAQEAELTPVGATLSGSFHFSVAISGDVALVGAPADTVGADPLRGSAYVFTRSGTTWTQQARLTAPDGAPEDSFGGAVALSSATALVGAGNDDVGANVSQGSAYVFTLRSAPGRPAAKSPRGRITSRNPTLRWAAAARAATYEVRIWKGAKLLAKKVGVAKTSWKCTDRLPRRAYLTWKVRAMNEVGTGAWSSGVRFRVR